MTKCVNGESHDWSEELANFNEAGEMVDITPVCSKCGRSTDGQPIWLPSVFNTWDMWICDENACKECRQFDRSMFEPATEPQLPPEGCTCADGCRCRYVQVPYPPKAKDQRPF